MRFKHTKPKPRRYTNPAVHAALPVRQPSTTSNLTRCPSLCGPRTTAATPRLAACPRLPGSSGLQGRTRWGSVPLPRGAHTRLYTWGSPRGLTSAVALAAHAAAASAAVGTRRPRDNPRAPLMHGLDRALRVPPPPVALSLRWHGSARFGMHVHQHAPLSSRPGVAAGWYWRPCLARRATRSAAAPWPHPHSPHLTSPSLGGARKLRKVGGELCGVCVKDVLYARNGVRCTVLHALLP